jgi:hypothetical protein
MVIQANYTNSLGKQDWVLHYYRIEYGNRFWRWLFGKDATETFRYIATELGLPIRDVRDYRNIEVSGSSDKYTTQIFLDKKE